MQHRRAKFTALQQQPNLAQSCCPTASQTGLECLNVRGNPFGATGCSILINSIRSNRSLFKLDMGNCELMQLPQIPAASGAGAGKFER